MSIEERLQRIENGEPVEDEFKIYKEKENRCKKLIDVMFHDNVNMDVTKRRLSILMEMNDNEIAELEKLYNICLLEDETCKPHKM